MKIFHVFWESKITAETPEDAAKIALEMINDPESPARCFRVGEIKKSKPITIYKDVPV